jgi:LytS/YehU family sensor histidine kinase
VVTISKKNEFLPFTVLALEKLSMIYSKTGNFKPAFDNHLEYIRLKDSLASSKSKAELNDLEISYKTVQKEQEIELLKKDNSIKNLELADNRRSKIMYTGGLVLAILLFGAFYYQRNQRNRIKFQKLKAELETKVLRLQMNPHFIFNSLNSIENFIMQNEKRLASDYLNKFARLIRMILDSSRDEAVPVSRDMEALQLYIDLEQLRFNNKFSYKTYIDPALAAGDYRVPSLLIQPYVENAIVHGLAHSENKDLNLSVTAMLEEEKIKYIIQDNGIGREKAKEYNAKNKPYHKSIGLEITEARINIFNKQEENGNAIVFTDLFDENKKPDGTKVEIIIKAA